MSTNYSMQHYFVAFVFLLFASLFIADVSAQEKQYLVLLPIEVSESDASFESDFGAALEEGLQQNFTVFYGAEVEKLLEKEYEKIDCTVESCNQALAVAFNGELIADASIKRTSNGYLLKLRITNVLTNEVVKTVTTPCRGCDELSIISKLKTMGGLPSGSEESVAPISDSSNVSPSVHYHDLKKPFVVQIPYLNESGRKRSRFVQLNVSLLFRHKELELSLIELQPLYVAKLFELFETQSDRQIRTPDYQEQLRLMAMAEVNNILKKYQKTGQVDRVLFTDIVMQ